jgi:hypothetical protein
MGPHASRFQPVIQNRVPADICNRTDLMAGFWHFEGAVADGAHLLEIQRWRILLLQRMWTEARIKSWEQNSFDRPGRHRKRTWDG